MAGKGATEISLEERKEIEHFLSIDCKTGTIARHLGRSHSGIKTEIRRYGGRKNYNATKAQELSNLAKESKIRKIQKNLTNEQIEKILSLAKEGASKNQISKLTGVSDHRLTRFFKENKIEYAAKNYTAFMDRISSLEMQMEIIIDQLKELHDNYIKNK